MYVDMLTCINRPPGQNVHEFAEDELLMVDGQLMMFHGGRLYAANYVGDPDKFSYIRPVYAVSNALRDAPDTPEHAVFLDACAQLRLQKFRERTSVKANRPGHVYVDRHGEMCAYLGHRRIVNDQLMALEGHLYIKAGHMDLYAAARRATLGGPDFVSACRDRLLLEVRADGAVTATRAQVTVHVYRKPRRMLADLGPLANLDGSADAVMVTGLGSSADVFRLPQSGAPGQLSISAYGANQREVTYVAYSV